MSIPLPADDELSDKNRRLLRGLPDANIFRMVANAPNSLKPFLDLAGSLLMQSEFDKRAREIAILRIATITGSHYEWAQHVRIAKLVGVTDDEIERVGVDGPVSGFDASTRLVIDAAEDLTRNVRLDDRLLEALLAEHGTRRTTEFILCCSYFNMVSRFLESTRVPLEAAPLI